MSRLAYLESVVEFPYRLPANGAGPSGLVHWCTACPPILAQFFTVDNIFPLPESCVICKSCVSCAKSSCVVAKVQPPHLGLRKSPRVRSWTRSELPALFDTQVRAAVPREWFAVLRLRRRDSACAGAAESEAVWALIESPTSRIVLRRVRWWSPHRLGERLWPEPSGGYLRCF